MSKDDDDTLDDVNSLMNMIGGAKKKGVQIPPPPAEKIQTTPGPPAEPGIPDPASGGGDFSALMKKLGMVNKAEPAPQPAPATHPVSPEPVEAADDFDDLLEDVPILAPEPVPPRAETGGKDVRETLGRLLSTMGKTAPPLAPAPEETPVEIYEEPEPARQAPRQKSRSSRSLTRIQKLPSGSPGRQRRSRLLMPKQFRPKKSPKLTRRS